MNTPNAPAHVHESPLTVDVAPVKAAIAAAHEPAETLVKLAALQGKLQAREPELVKLVAADDMPAAAELTMLRLKLREVLPQQIAEAEARRIPSLLSLWDVLDELKLTARGVAEIIESRRARANEGLKVEVAERKLQQVDPDLRAALAPVLGPDLEPGITWSIRYTPLGDRLVHLPHELDQVDRNWPTRPNLHGSHVSLEGEARQIMRRAETLLAKVKEALAGPARSH